MRAYAAEALHLYSLRLALYSKNSIHDAFARARNPFKGSNLPGHGVERTHYEVVKVRGKPIRVRWVGHKVKRTD